MFVYPGGSAGRAQTVFEIVVAEAGQRLGGAVFMQHPDIRQGHSVEGVVLAGGIDGHVAEDEPAALGEGGGKAVIAHHVPGKAGGAAQPEGAGLFPRLVRIQQGQAADMSRMARCVLPFCRVSSTVVTR